LNNAPSILVVRGSDWHS